MLIAAVALAACGNAAHVRPVKLMLDFTPNAAHAGIYAATAHHYDRSSGIALQVIPPPSPADSVKLLEAGRVGFSVLDIHDLAIAGEHGAQLVGVMAIVERPLAAVIAQPQIRTPVELQGRTVGVAGDPSDIAVLDSTVQGAGGDPRRVKAITIDGDAVPDLLAGRVAAATAFWSDEGVALAQARPGFHIFRVDRYGAPSYPELVLCTRRSTLAHHPGLVAAVVRALRRGYALTISDPSAAAADLTRQVPGLNPKLVDDDLAALRPALAGRNGRPGELDQRALRAWSGWELRFGIVSHRPDVTQLFAISR
jgi:ABC-type nitrate/sulfonate/bicarbonate transport system substrate-binding protein